MSKLYVIVQNNRYYEEGSEIPISYFFEEEKAKNFCEEANKKINKWKENKIHSFHFYIFKNIKFEEQEKIKNDLISLFSIFEKNRFKINYEDKLIQNKDFDKYTFKVKIENFDLFKNKDNSIKETIEKIQKYCKNNKIHSSDFQHSFLREKGYDEYTSFEYIEVEEERRLAI